MGRKKEGRGQIAEVELKKANLRPAFLLGSRAFTSAI
jgi:hypothetical protein